MSRNKYEEIDLAEYIPLKSYVILNPEFRVGLFRELIVKFGSASALADLIGVNKSSIYDWFKGRVKIPLSNLVKCAKLVGMSKSELFKFIYSATARYASGTIFVKDWKLILNEELSEWFGLLRGDGCISKKYVGFTNMSLALSLFFMKILENVFGVSKSNIEITIDIPSRKSTNDSLSVIKLLYTKGYNRVIKRKRGKGKKILLSPRVNSKVLAQLLKNLVKILQQLIENSSQKVKVAYVRGFAAAEGSACQTNSVRVVSLTNKDLNELRFIKKLLYDVGIIYTTFERDKKGIYKLKITTQPQLRLFYEKIGFGKYKEKNEKLANILRGYKKVLTRIYYKSKIIRYNEILQLIKKKGKLTGKEIASGININYTYVNKLLNEMLSKRLIYRTDGWPYFYHCKK